MQMALHCPDSQVTQWLDTNTFRCPRLNMRLSPQACTTLRSRVMTLPSALRRPFEVGGNGSKEDPDHFVGLLHEECLRCDYSVDQADRNATRGLQDASGSTIGG